MAKLILKFDDRDLGECAVGTQPVSIGRLPDNVMTIDNPAVSGRHARVYKEGDNYVLEDLKSTNGTFVNDRPIARHTLREGDVILIAKHRLLFTHAGGEQAADMPTSGSDGTMLPETQTAGVAEPETAIPTLHGRIGTIKVKSGNTGQTDYVLSTVTTLIGRTEMAQIRLKGWFKPKIAAAIARRGDGFTITPMGGKVVVNGEAISGRRDLSSGDTIVVSGVTLELTLS